jgi:hypothetical protein
LRILSVGILLFLFFATAQGQTLTKDGIANNASDDPDRRNDRYFIQDSSFEDGNCAGSSQWTCWNSTSCEGIINPLNTWGYPAYHGINAAWLGGYCDGEANNNTLCQDTFVFCFYLYWYFMGNISSECSQLTIIMNGYTIFEHTMTMAEHNYGTWSCSYDHWGLVDISAFFGLSAELCIEWTACGEDTNGDGLPDEENDSMLIDWVLGDMCDPAAAATMTFSTIKALY